MTSNVILGASSAPSIIVPPSPPLMAANNTSQQVPWEISSTKEAIAEFVKAIQEVGNIAVIRRKWKIGRYSNFLEDLDKDLDDLTIEDSWTLDGTMLTLELHMAFMFLQKKKCDITYIVQSKQAYIEIDPPPSTGFDF